jgi:hypothetical protein
VPAVINNDNVSIARVPGLVSELLRRSNITRGPNITGGLGKPWISVQQPGD